MSLLHSVVRARWLGSGQRLVANENGWTTGGSTGTRVGLPAKATPTELHVRTKCAHSSAAKTDS